MEVLDLPREFCIDTLFVWSPYMQWLERLSWIHRINDAISCHFNDQYLRDRLFK